MTKEEYNKKPAIEHLRLMVQNFNVTNETFNESFTMEELLAIHKAWMLSGWDIFPDTWTLRQIKEAIKGIIPRWNDNEKPIY